MPLNVIKTNDRVRVPTPSGSRRDIITAADQGAGTVRASLHDIEPGRSCEFDAGQALAPFVRDGRARRELFLQR